MTRWCHSSAQLGDLVTKYSDTARAPWELFVRRGFGGNRCTIPNLNPRDTVLNVDLTYWKNLTKTSLRLMFHEIQRMSCMSGQFSQPRFRHTCSGLRFLAPKAADPELRDGFVLVLCVLVHPNS